MIKPKIFIKTKKEALIFVSEFLVMMKKEKSHETSIKNIGVLEKRLKRKLENSSELRLNDFVEIIDYSKCAKIVSNFMPLNIRSSFRTYPPCPLSIKSQIFDKIKGTENKVNAFAFPFSNCILIAENTTRDMESVLIHEFLHYASELGSNWVNWRNGANRYKPWVVEGITELYTKRLAEANHITYVQHKKYEMYLNIIKQIEVLLGKENLKKIYFSGEIDTIFLDRIVSD